MGEATQEKFVRQSVTLVDGSGQNGYRMSEIVKIMHFWVNDIGNCQLEANKTEGKN